MASPSAGVQTGSIDKNIKEDIFTEVCSGGCLGRNFGVGKGCSVYVPQSAKSAFFSSFSFPQMAPAARSTDHSITAALTSDEPKAAVWRPHFVGLFRKSEGCLRKCNSYRFGFASVTLTIRIVGVAVFMCVFQACLVRGSADGHCGADEIESRDRNEAFMFKRLGLITYLFFFVSHESWNTLRTPVCLVQRLSAAFSRWKSCILSHS